MLRRGITPAILGAGLVMGCLVLTHIGGARAMTFTLNVKDLPQYGLIIVAPADAQYQAEISHFNTGPNAGPMMTAMQPYWAVMKNSDSSRSLVAYNLVWEMTRADGFVVTRQAAYSNSGAFMRHDFGPNPAAVLSEGHAIAPGSSRLVSPFFALNPAEPSGLGGIGIGSQDQSMGQKATAAAGRKDPAQLAALAAEDMQRYVAMTVSIDGAFFSDGSFVGPDSTGYFSEFKALADADQDLLAEIARARQSGKGSAEIFDRISALANQNCCDSLQADSTPMEQYKYHSKRFAQNLLRMRTVLKDDDKALSTALVRLPSQRANLHKQ
ncbi:MAG: hypothetical protein ACREDR_04785 [Blastocatellia bacterium]